MENVLKLLEAQEAKRSAQDENQSFPRTLLKTAQEEGMLEGLIILSIRQL